ncbi:MAG: 16S rRNA (adenine(1518)-N(6)/adenine(1519)-N(6))-dimethyltransferase RsmA [Verrucomicrobiota bacterium]|nr:16S rRNA (adenine(1518)-N(6)/adenine(1519)-N(6))-dimethyltransferase RsmA [Verrucomicrobiota bacterium]
MKLSEIDATLREIGVAPVKTLGQNFLHDQNLARWIVDRANLTAEDYVVEVGPGLGALTEFLLASGARVLAIEKDARLAGFLRERFPTELLEVIHGDALEFDVRRLFAQPRVKFVGNLPYNVSSQILLQFAKYPSPISLWLLMLQKEMARRLSAKPGTPDYGALTLLMQLHYRVEYLRTIPPSVFLPRPDVESAFVKLEPRSANELPDCDAARFKELVRKGFSQRRKQLGKLLRPELADWPTAASAIGANPKTRAEELSLQQWIALTNFSDPTRATNESAASQEDFAVVDQEDHVIGHAPRATVHGNNSRHRAVHILLFNREGELFLQKRSRLKDRHPGVWDSSAAGHVDYGEEYDDCARRELKEELGIADQVLERVAKLPASEQTGQEFIWLYRGHHDGPFQLAASEIELGEFFPPQVITKWLNARPEDFAPGFVECWRVFRTRAPNPGCASGPLAAPRSSFQ